MYCKDIMIDRKDVISVHDDLTLSKAIDRMDLYGMRALPVINFGRYQGVIERYDILERIHVSRNIDLDVATVHDVMRDNIQIVYASDFIEKAAVAFHNHRYQFLPVMMDDTADQFLGIIPAGRILDILATSLGFDKPVHRLTLEILDYKGELAKLTRGLMQSGASISSFVTVLHRESKDETQDSRIRLVIKFDGDLEAVLNQCRAQGIRVTHIDRYEG